jgi:hypothetical protein
MRKQMKNTTKTKRFPYRVIVDWSVEDDMYVARIPKLEGILGLDEHDPARAIRQVVARGWDALAALRAHKYSLPVPDVRTKERSGRFYVRLLPEIHTSLCEWAEEAGVSMNALVSHILTAATSQRTVFPRRSSQTKPRARRQPQAA